MTHPLAASAFDQANQAHNKRFGDEQVVAQPGTGINLANLALPELARAATAAAPTI